jgi:hypothetical protein
MREEIRTSDHCFMRCDLQPIELPLENSILYFRGITKVQLFYTTLAKLLYYVVI